MVLPFSGSRLGAGGTAPAAVCTEWSLYSLPTPSGLEVDELAAPRGLRPSSAAPMLPDVRHVPLVRSRSRLSALEAPEPPIEFDLGGSRDMLSLSRGDHAGMVTYPETLKEGPGADAGPFLRFRGAMRRPRVRSGTGDRWWSHLQGRTGPVLKRVGGSDDPAPDRTIVGVRGDPCPTRLREVEHSGYDRNREVVQ